MGFIGAWHPECALNTCKKAAVLGAFKISFLFKQLAMRRTSVTYEFSGVEEFSPFVGHMKKSGYRVEFRRVLYAFFDGDDIIARSSHKRNGTIEVTIGFYEDRTEKEEGFNRAAEIFMKGLAV